MIETERLTLRPLPPALVVVLADRDWEAARAAGPPFDIDEDTFTDDELDLLARQPQPPDRWLMRVAVLKATRQAVGRVGFHAPPDADGVVEIGYSVSPDFRRQGFAVEMAAALIAWAAAEGCTACVASALPDNAASLATIARLGFVRVGQRTDDEDVVELVHRLDLRRAIDDT